MLAYVARRIMVTIPVMAIVALAVFSLLYVMPGDPAAVIAGEQASPADVARIRARIADRHSGKTYGHAFVGSTG